MSDHPKRVVILGQGYVGLALAVHAVHVGFDVVGLDTDGTRIDRLVRCESYIQDISDALLVECRDTGRYRATIHADECAAFDIAVITVPTPLTEGLPDLTFIEQSAHTLAEHIRPEATVILESTTYPGTTTELVRGILEADSDLIAGKDFHLGYSPERIDPGNPTWNIVNTPKVVSGIDDASLRSVQAFYDQICETTVPVSTPQVAELVKLLENTFRHVNIALVNELAMFAQSLDVDVWEAIAAAATKPYGFMPFYPGPGVGGHCLPIDPSYLSWQVRRTIGQSFRFIELANDINEHMPDYVVRRLMLALNDRGRAVRGSRILILGFAYKRNTADARQSPAIAVAERLVALGAEVRARGPVGSRRRDRSSGHPGGGNGRRSRRCRRCCPVDRPRLLRPRCAHGVGSLRPRHPKPGPRGARRAALSGTGRRLGRALPGSGVRVQYHLAARTSRQCRARARRRGHSSLLERCESGRIGLTANELTWETGSEGSNPSLSAQNRHATASAQRRLPTAMLMGRTRAAWTVPAPGGPTPGR